MKKIYSYPKLRGATHLRRCAATLLATVALAAAPMGALAADNVRAIYVDGQPVSAQRAFDGITEDLTIEPETPDWYTSLRAWSATPQEGTNWAIFRPDLGDAQTASVLSKYTVYTVCGNYSVTSRPKKWQIYGSNDYDAFKQDATWTLVHQVDDAGFGKDNYTSDRANELSGKSIGKSFSISSQQKAYKYYKIVLLESIGGPDKEGLDYCSVTELRIDGATAHTHNLSEVERIAPTCKEKGYVRYRCATCEADDIREIDEDAPLAHRAATSDVLPKCVGCDSLLINNAADLTEFTARVNAGTTDLSVVMTADITLNADLLANLNADGTPKDGYTPVASTPIAKKYTIGSTGDGQYKGTFNGDGHSITGMYIYDNGNDIAAPFGFVGQGGMVKGITVKDSYIYSNSQASGIAHYNWSGTISDCHVSGGVVHGDSDYSVASGVCNTNYGNAKIENCTNSANVKSGNIAVGICRQLSNGGGISGCLNRGAVTASKSAVGICIDASAPISNCANHGRIHSSGSNAGGICQSAQNTTISECTNSGTIHGKDYAAGICVSAKGTTITGCTNSGDVEAEKVYLYSGIAGICDAAEDSKISKCVNSGSISANVNMYNYGGYVAGICGLSRGQSTIRDCYNTGNLTALACKGLASSTSVNNPSVVAGISFCADGKGVVENCFSTGTLTLDHDGDDEHNKIFPVSPTGTNCYYTRQAGLAATDQDGIEGRDEADFQSGAVAYLLNGCTSADDAVWRQDLLSDSHPRLAIDGAEAIVYAARHLRCDGKTAIAADTHYSNDAADAKADVVDAHQFGNLTSDTPDADTQNLYSVLCDNCLTATSPDTKVIKSLYGDGTDIRISTNNHSTPWVAEQPVDIADFGDATPYCAPVAFEAPKASYKRTMTASWATLCLPFGFEADGNDADLAFYEPTSVGTDCVSLTRRTGTIPAATPLFVWSRGAAQLSIASTEPAAMVTTPADGASVDGLQLTGAFAPTDINNGYILSGNALWDVTTLSDKARVRAFRAYLLATTAQQSAPRLTIAIDGAATAIDNLNAADAGEAEIYDATGRRTDRLQRGVNIVRRGGKTMKISVK